MKKHFFFLILGVALILISLHLTHVYMRYDEASALATWYGAFAGGTGILGACIVFITCLSMSDQDFK